jgi:four helix bundle suffix protein
MARNRSASATCNAPHPEVPAKRASQDALDPCERPGICASSARQPGGTALADDRDFLRVRGLLEWPADHAYARRLRELDRVPDATYATFRNGIGIEDPAISTNVAIGLIRVTSYLLDRRIRHLEEAFIKEGGLRERMTRARLRERGR